MGKKIIIEAYGLTTRAWTLHEKYGYGCSECCNGDRCDEDCTAKYKGNRAGCPHCKGKGWIPASEATLKTMESNKSKGVEAQVEKMFHTFFGHLRDQQDKRVHPSEIVRWIFKNIPDLIAAHPQQSEGVEDEIERYKQWVADLQSGMYVNCVYCGHRYGREDETPVAMADVLKAHIEQCPEHPLSKALARIKELESKAEGVEERRKLAETIREHLNSVGYALGEDTTNLIAQVLKIDGERIGFTLAHPQQSEGVEERQGASIHPLANTYTDGAEALKWYNELSPLEILHLYRHSLAHPQQSEGVGQAADGDLDNLVWAVETGRCSIKSAVRLAYQRATAFHPSEPAALKDGEERAIREIWNKYSGTTWVVPPEKFTAALKEFASLLTNHKS